MTVPFNSTPSNLLTPIFSTESDNSRADQGSADMPYSALIIAQRRSAGTGVANTLYRGISSADRLATLGGRGSMAHRMGIAWFRANKETDLSVLLLDDNGAGVAASGTITVTGTATAAGTLHIWLGGEYIPVAVASGDAQNAIASAINTAIGLATDLPVTSTVSTNVVTVSFRHKGLCGNEYDMRVNYQIGQEYPAGVSLAFVQLTGGTTNPVLTTAIAALGEQRFHAIALPYTDATSLAAIETELADRFGPLRQIEGEAYAVKRDTYANLATFGLTRNSAFVSVVGAYNLPQPSYELAATLTAVVAKYAAIDPAVPLGTLELTGVLPWQISDDEFTRAERNILLGDGISTLVSTAGGKVAIERMVTTYRTNAAGSPDTSYRNVETMNTLMLLRYTWRIWMSSKYPRAKIAGNDVQVPAGVQVLTPNGGRAEAIAWFMAMQDRLLVEGLDAFKAALRVERNATDANRMDFLLPPDLINQLIVVATNMQFRI
jgi:phage tail sheath gpL-like